MSTFEHDRLENQLANREAIDETIRENGLLMAQLDLPIVDANDLSASSKTVEVEARSMQRFGVSPGLVSSAGYCRPTLSRQRSSNQLEIGLMRIGY